LIGRSKFDFKISKLEKIEDKSKGWDEMTSNVSPKGHTIKEK